MPTELEYLREIERLAHRVTLAASDELQHHVTALARALHHYHFEGDGCLEEDRPLVRLFGAAVLRPGGLADYDETCARFGVEPRPEGWALWHTWGDGELKVTMVVSAVETTEGLFQNWSHGRSVDPVTPLPSQVALVHMGWMGPMTLSPRGVRRMGVGGQPADFAPPLA
ncbi:hypothetical protein STRCI_006748 [Streptomyces cinnabarinus]|uniref:Uncharacterized protein n=1 Tax=Streptomyces cinnabarinus TaxID=67287 RepID=A0ABY7KNW7_9ACTN|nr:hypothetical protein [Streptomyces cinnabarinus]WAZ25265.1 hypothetical protein STRCI_006748 [Streptomyces cinnabarinus]